MLMLNFVIYTNINYAVISRLRMNINTYFLRFHIFFQWQYNVPTVSKIGNGGRRKETGKKKKTKSKAYE